MRATVIIPVRDGVAFLRPCLTALLAQQGVDFDVLVVDNGSSDGSADLVAAEFPTLRLLRSATALGFSGAVNRGLREVLPGAPDVVVLLNQDTQVHPGWLAALLAPLERDPLVGAVGCKALFPNGRVQHAGGEVLWPLGYGRNRGYDEPDDGRYEAEDSPDYLAGMALALRCTMLAQIGLLDEGFNPAYFEDTDLCLRARAAGWRLVYAPAAVLTHHEGASRAAGNYAHAALLERNRLRMVLKHLSAERLFDEFFPAEKAQLRTRARDGGVQVLRRAYLDALLMLPEIADGSAWAGRHDEVAETLVALRRKAVAAERLSGDGGWGTSVAQGAGWDGGWGMGDGRQGTRRQGDPLRGRGKETRRQGDKEIGDDAAETQNSKLKTQNSRHPFTLSPLHPFTPSPFHDPRPAARPPVAIIVLTWNGLSYTQECLESLRALTADVEYQVIVVDNGSSDGTREYLRGLSWITLVENATNEGFTRGNNIGLRAVPDGYDVLLLNNDTRILQANWLARLREVAHSQPDYGIVGAKLLMSDGKLVHAGTYMPTSSFWGWQIGSNEENIGQYPGVRAVEGVVGACMYIRRDLLDMIGPLDERFFSYYEDTDYCLRALAAGYKVVCAGDVSLIHHENVSTKLNRVDFWGMYGHSQNLFREKWDSYFHQRYRHRLFWHSVVSAPTGYAVSSRQLVLALDRQAIDVRLAYLYGVDISERNSGDPRIEQLRGRPKDTALPQVVYHQGDAFHKNSGGYRIGYTMLEVTGIPADWVRQANQMDEVWVPSHFNRETFRDSGVTRPIHVIPLGVDPNYFHPGIASRRIDERFTFLSVFEWGERKAPEVLLRAYAAAFSARDDVLLVLKVDNRDGDVNVAQQIAALGLPPNGPRVALLYNQELPAYQLGCLYRSADCFVLPSRGEGWGMPILEAMACGLPAIATNWSAQTEFIRDDLCYPLRVARLIPAVAKCPYYAGFSWADPDQEHLAYLMRYVYEHRDEACAVGRRAAEAVAREWSWDQAARRIVERLGALT